MRRAAAPRGGARRRAARSVINLDHAPISVAWLNDINLELRSVDSTRQILPCRFDGDNFPIFQAAYGQNYELVVRNNGRQKFVVKAHIGDLQDSQNLLISNDCFKPLHEDDTAIFSGFQTKFHKENLEGSMEWRPLQITRDEEQGDASVERISVDIYSNAGKLTYNRGGGRARKDRIEQLRNGTVTVPGTKESRTFPCLPAPERWESKEGEYLGRRTIGVEAKHDLSQDLEALRLVMP